MAPKRVSAIMEPSNVVDIGSPEFRTDEFRMYSLKVIECSRRYAHNWTLCPFAHPNEKAKRRDPRKYAYTGVACPFIKQSNRCPYEDHCPYAHNPFEYWLHPSRYRTQLCNIAASCHRTVCFFAHTIDELRVPGPIEMPANMFLNNPLQTHPLPNWSPLAPNFVGPVAPPLSNTDLTSAATLEPRARHILHQLTAARQITAELRATDSPMNDLSEIQTLISLLQQQQLSAGVSDRNPDVQVNFLNAMFHSLAQVIASSVMLTAEKERLTKLIHWMYVQLVQNKQSLFSSPDPLTLFTPQQREALQIPPLTQLGEGIPSRHSLSSIPEMVQAEQRLMALRGDRSSYASNSSAPSLEPLNLLPVPATRVTSLDRSSRSLGSFASEIRQSDESSRTRLSAARTSRSFGFQRSSADSEPCPRLSRNIVSHESSRMSWEDLSMPSEFIFHDWLSHTSNQPPVPPPPPSSGYQP